MMGSSCGGFPTWSMIPGLNDPAYDNSVIELS
jgi:hypothetical protein